MAIPNYSPPQMVLDQNLEQDVFAALPELPACVMGPAYLLSRWNHETTVGTAFDAAGQTIPWQYVDDADATQDLPSTYKVDLDGVQVWAKDLRATLAAYTSGDTKIYLADLATPNIIRIAGNHFVGSSLPTLFRSRPAAIGDEVDVDDGSTVRSRKIVGFLGVDIDSSYGTNAAADDSKAAGNAYNPLEDATPAAASVLLQPGGFTVTPVQTSLNLNVRGSSNAGRYVSEDFTITVTEGGAPGAGGAVFAISSSSGLYSATGVESTNSAGAYLINDSELAGATVTIADDTVVTGQVFKVRVNQAYERLVADTQITISDAGDGYTGSKDTTYIIEVIQGSTGDTATGAKIKIYDTAGLETVQSSVTLTNATPVSMGALGLSVEFDMDGTPLAQAGLRAGDVYYVQAKAPSQSTTNFDKAVLNGPVVDTATFVDTATALGAEFKLRYNGEIAADDAADETAWTADAEDGVTVDVALALYVSTRASGYQWVAYDDAEGELHLSYRAAIPVAQTTGLQYVESDSDIVSKIGPITPANTLAYGASRALAGSQAEGDGERIYFLPVSEDTADAYAIALKKLESTDAIYTLVPLTNSSSIKSTVRSHVLAMSSNTRKKFRQAYIGEDSPGEYAELLVAADSSNYTATVTPYGAENLLVTMTDADDGIDFDSLNIVEGDIFRLSVAEEDYVIDSVLNATQLLLQSGPAVAVTPAVPFQIWKADTATSQGDYIIAVSNALKHRRVTPHWYEDGMVDIDGVPTLIPAYFVAAEMAGLRSALPPQVGLSRVELTSITSCPAMYTKYGQDDLDRIAADGVSVITQDIEAGAVYVRHHLTSETDKGSLYYEANVTAVVDYVSFMFTRSSLGTSVGRVTTSNRRKLADLYNDAATLLDSLKQADVDSVHGPVIADWANLKFQRNATVRDRWDVSADLAIGLPINTVWVTLNAYVDLPETTA